MSNELDHSEQDFVQMARQNPNVNALLIGLRDMDLNDWWLTSGCLVQTIWNIRSGNAPTDNIKDYDIFYADKDLSWEAEDAVIKLVKEKFKDLPVDLEVRNQLRVHLWYKEKHGIKYPPLKSSGEAMLRYPSTTTAIGLRLNKKGHPELHAPFGIEDALGMMVYPNDACPLPKLYAQKIKRWKQYWPNLIVL